MYDGIYYLTTELTTNVKSERKNADDRSMARRVLFAVYDQRYRAK